MVTMMSCIFVSVISIASAKATIPRDVPETGLGNLTKNFLNESGNGLFRDSQRLDSSSSEISTQHDPSILLTIVIGIISLVTIVGNSMVIVSILIFRKLRRLSNMFIISLATADLVMGSVVMPFGAHYFFTGRWQFGQVMCDLWTSIDVLTVTASICTLCAISLDRYIAIVKPFQYTRRSTQTFSRALIVAVWIVSSGIAFIPIMKEWWKTRDEHDIQCYEDPQCCEFRPNKTYAVVSSLFSFYIPMLVMVFAYSIVFKVAIKKRCIIRQRDLDLKNSLRSGSKKFLLSPREYRAVFTMGIIMGTFIICWLPFFITNIIQVFCERCISPTTFNLLNWFGFANSFFNPFIYCHSKEFRNAFKRLLLCGICRDGYQQTCRASLSTSYRRRQSVNRSGSVNSVNRSGSVNMYSSFFPNNTIIRRISSMQNNEKLKKKKMSSLADLTQASSSNMLSYSYSRNSLNRLQTNRNDEIALESNNNVMKT